MNDGPANPPWRKLPRVAEALSLSPVLFLCARTLCHMYYATCTEHHGNTSLLVCLCMGVCQSLLGSIMTTQFCFVCVCVNTG